MSVFDKAKSILKIAEAILTKAMLGITAAAPSVLSAAEMGAASTGHADIIPFLEKMKKACAGAGAFVNAINGAQGTGQHKAAVAATQLDAMLKDSGFFGDKFIADAQGYEKALVAISGNFADLYAALAPKTAATAAATPAAEPVPEPEPMAVSAG